MVSVQHNVADGRERAGLNPFLTPGKPRHVAIADGHTLKRAAGSLA